MGGPRALAGSAAEGIWFSGEQLKFSTSFASVSTFASVVVVVVAAAAVRLGCNLHQLEEGEKQRKLRVKHAV